MTGMWLGLMRYLRKIRQDFNRAMPRSTGARAWARARLTVRWVGEFTAGWLPECGGDPVSGALVGAVGEDRDALSQVRMILWVRAADRLWVRPGRAGETHSTVPTGSVTTWAFTPCRRCLAE